MHNYKKLEIYAAALELTKQIYAITKQWPEEEKYVLTPQIRRSSISVQSNICEGSARISDADFIRFLYSAYASLQETESHLLLAKHLNYIKEAEYTPPYTKNYNLS